jgi:hypothetical protein
VTPSRPSPPFPRLPRFWLLSLLPCPHPSSPSFFLVQGQLWGEMLTSGAALEYIACPKIFGLAEAAWACPALHAAGASEAAAAAATGGTAPPPAPEVAEEEQEGDRRIDYSARLDASWANFANALGQQHLAVSDSEACFQFRLPPPQLKLVDTELATSCGECSVVVKFHASCEFPGLGIRYTVSSVGVADEPSFESPLCALNGPTEVRCALPPAANGQGSDAQAQVQVRVRTFDCAGRGSRSSTALSVST